MRTVHRFSALLLAAAMLFSLAACGSNGPGMDAQAEGADAVAAEPEATAAPRTVPEADGVPRFLTIETTDTDFGTITIPKLSAHNLDTDTAREANALFEKIRDDLIAAAEETKNSGAPADASNALCTTQTAAHEGSLSVLVSYRPDIGAKALRYEAVTFDTESGDIISPDKVISDIGGRSRTETENAIVFYANKTLGESVRMQTLYECAASGAVPQGLDGPFLRDDRKRDMLSGYRENQLVGTQTGAESDAEEPSGSWDELPRSPTAYVDADGQLLVRAAIPGNSADSVTTMVAIGANDTETEALNPKNPSGTGFGLGVIPTDAAMGLAALAMGLDGDNTDEDGTTYRLTIDSTALLSANGGPNEPAYVVSVFTGNGDTARIRVAAYYAIGVFSTQVWRMDIAAGKWVAQQTGSSYLVNAVTDGQSRNALAVVRHKPNAFELWRRPPVAEIDLGHYAYTQGEASSMLVYAVQDGTTIRFAGGGLDGEDNFSPGKSYDEFELDAGECMLVRCKLPESPAQAVIADAGRNEGVLALFTSKEHPVTTYQYVTADPALQKPEEGTGDSEASEEEITAEVTW